MSLRQFKIDFETLKSLNISCPRIIKFTGFHISSKFMINFGKFHKNCPKAIREMRENLGAIPDFCLFNVVLLLCEQLYLDFVVFPDDT